MNAAYNQSHLRTPAFDALAAEGLTFQYAYANQAVYARPHSSTALPAAASLG